MSFNSFLLRTVNSSIRREGKIKQDTLQERQEKRPKLSGGEVVHEGPSVLERH